MPVEAHGTSGKHLTLGEIVEVALTSAASPRWGQPGAPLLPRTLRRAFADEKLPGWLLQDLHLPADATALALDSSVWAHVDQIPARVERYLLGLVTYRAEDIRDLRVTDGNWPPKPLLADIRWPTRVGNALEHAGLRTSARIKDVTYGQLLSMPAIGVKSALEFAAIADVVTAAPAPPVLDKTMRQGLTDAADEDWAERAAGDDPRFRDVLPAHPGSFSDLIEEALDDPDSQQARALAQSLPQVRARAEEIAAEPIDEALTRLLTSFGASDRDVKVIVARYGWGGHSARTLGDIGDTFGITRERVRQIVQRWSQRLQDAYLPQVARAVQLLTERAPLTANDAARLLIDLRLCTVPMHPAALEAAARLVGYEVTFQLDSADGIDYVRAQGVAGIGPIFLTARREAGRVGVSNVEEVEARLQAEGHQYPAGAVQGALHSSTKIEFLQDDWFWVPDIPPDRNRLRNVTQRILSVTSRLDVATIRHGIRRHYRFKQIDLVPSTSVLTAFYRAHPEFVVHDDGSISSRSPLDYRHVLGPAESAFVNALRASPTGLMDRTDLERAVTERGVNPSTFSVFTTYSPILDHPALNVWCLRGQVIDPAEVEALRAVAASRDRRQRTLEYGWDEDGRLRLTADLANIHSPVIYIPVGISRYVAGRQFEAKTQEGTPAGTISVDDSSGASWGYGPFLRRRGAEPGDSLTIRFNLVSGTVTLSLDDETALLEEPE
jgi:YD repeat-containing protein